MYNKIYCSVTCKAIDKKTNIESVVHPIKIELFVIQFTHSILLRLLLGYSTTKLLLAYYDKFF